jgi:hypothetical protein
LLIAELFLRSSVGTSIGRCRVLFLLCGLLPPIPGYPVKSVCLAQAPFDLAAVLVVLLNMTAR